MAGSEPAPAVDSGRREEAKDAAAAATIVVIEEEGGPATAAAAGAVERHPSRPTSHFAAWAQASVDRFQAMGI